MRLKEVNGSYNPSFFNMVLETEEDILLAYKKYTATFTHEFIHYLQDLILPYNIRMNFTNLSWFQRIRESIHEYGCLTLPFANWDENTNLTMQQFEYTFGLNKPDIAFVEHDVQINSIDEIKSDVVEFRGRRFILYKYEMSLKDYSNKYILGARDLLEYIAYKIESKHYQTSDLPQLPYCSVDLLFEYYGLSNIPDDIKICIAEFCLYNDNPIRMLFLNFLKNEEFKKTAESLTYNSVYSSLLGVGFVTTDNRKESLSDKFDRRINDFMIVLDTQYVSFSEIRKWILKVHQFIKDKFSQSFIFSDLYRMDIEEFKDFIDVTIGEIGLPLVMNEKQECISLQSEDIKVSQFSQFYILQEFLNAVLYSPVGTVCPVEQFCFSNGGVQNEYCSFHPGKKIANNEDCCYTDFFKSFGLMNIKLIF